MTKVSSSADQQWIKASISDRVRRYDMGLGDRVRRYNIGLGDMIWG